MFVVWGNQHEIPCEVHNVSTSPIPYIYIFIVIAVDETSILVAVQFPMQNIYESCDLGRAVWRSNVDVNQ